MSRPTPRERRLEALREVRSPEPEPTLLALVAPHTATIAKVLRERHDRFALAVLEPAHLALTWASAPDPLVRVARGLGFEPGPPPGRPAALVVAGGACAWLTADELDRAARETAP